MQIYAQRSKKHLGGIMWLTCSWCLEALCYVEEKICYSEIDIKGEKMIDSLSLTLCISLCT